MPKYLFQINDGEAHDSTWVDLPHIIVARMEAARLTAELVRDDSQSLGATVFAKSECTMEAACNYFR